LVLVQFWQKLAAFFDSHLSFLTSYSCDLVDHIRLTRRIDPRNYTKEKKQK
jgi:hypothetical protein